MRRTIYRLIKNAKYCQTRDTKRSCQNQDSGQEWCKQNNTQKSIKKNYIYNIIYKMASLVTPLVITPYVSRVLGAEGIGTYSYVFAVSTYFTLFAAMGTASYGQRQISYYQDNPKQRTLEFWNTELLSCGSVICVFIIYILFTVNQGKYQSLYWILTMELFTVAFDISWFFQGLEEFGKIVLRNVLIKISNLIFIFLFVKQENNLSVYVFGLNFFNLISAISLWPYLPRYLIRVSFRELQPLKNFFTVCSLFIPTIAISIYTVLDKTMIGWFCGNRMDNGYYEQATTIVRFVLTFVTALGTVIIPRIGFCFEKKQTELVRKYMYNSYKFVWFLGCPLCAGLIATAPNFIPWFLGEDFNPAIPLIRILSFLIIAVGISNTTGIQYLITTKKQNIFTISVVAGAFSNFILNLCFIPRWGARGAAAASVIAESIITVLQIFIVRKELSPLKIVSLSWKYITASTGMFIIIEGMSGILEPSIINSLILTVIGGVIYIIFLFALKDIGIQ